MDDMTQMLLDRMDRGFEAITTRLDRVNGRLDKHDQSIGDLRESGCAQYSAHRELLGVTAESGGLSRKQVASYGVGAGAVIVAFVELLKALAVHLGAK